MDYGIIFKDKLTLFLFKIFFKIPRKVNFLKNIFLKAYETLILQAYKPGFCENIFLRILGSPRFFDFFQGFPERNFFFKKKNH